MAEENQESESIFNPSRRSYVYESGKGTSSSNNRRRIFMIIGGIAILLLLVVVAVIATGGKGEKESNITPTPTIAIDTPTPIPTETPTPVKGTPTPTPKKTPTPKVSEAPISSVDPKTGLDRAKLTIAVKNGSGVAGAATKASDALKKLGYDVVSSGNADNFDYADTTIQVKSTKKTYVDLLKSDLSGTYTIGSATSDYAGSDADALVIVGKN